MALNDYTRLNKHVTHLGSTLLTSQIESNLKTYLDWGLLEIGGFRNVTMPTSGAYGGIFDGLRLVNDPNYTLGQVWETPRKDWVWETGITYSYEPIDISGVYVGGNLYTTGDATYGHHYNYPLGRVVFDSAIATTSVVKINHSYRNVQTYIADQAPWWEEIQYDSLRVDDDTLDLNTSGNWGVLSSHRVQLPAIVIEAVPKRKMRPYEMGTIGNYVYQDVNFHILAESRWWRNTLMDIISLEKDRTIWLYDNNSIADVTGYPLDERGMKVSSPKMYPTFVDDFRYKKMKFHDTAINNITSTSSRLKQATVRATVEVVMA